MPMSSNDTVQGIYEAIGNPEPREYHRKDTGNVGDNDHRDLVAIVSCWALGSSLGATKDKEWTHPCKQAGHEWSR